MSLFRPSGAKGGVLKQGRRPHGGVAHPLVPPLGGLGPQGMQKRPRLKMPPTLGPRVNWIHFRDPCFETSDGSPIGPIGCLAVDSSNDSSERLHGCPWHEIRHMTHGGTLLGSGSPSNTRCCQSIAVESGARRGTRDGCCPVGHPFRLFSERGSFRDPPMSGRMPPQPVAAQVSSIPPVIACGGGEGQASTIID